MEFTKLELLHGTSDKGNVNATKHFSSFMNIIHFAERQPGNCEVPTLYKLKSYSFLFVWVLFPRKQASYQQLAVRTVSWKV